MWREHEYQGDFMNDEKSEVIDDTTSEEKDKKEDKEEITDIDTPDGVLLGDEKKVEETKKTDVLDEEKEDKKQKEDTELTRIKSEVEKLRNDKRDLKKALHEARQERKGKKEDDVTLTDAELVQIVEQHKDDPTVLMNAVKYMVNQQVKGAKKEAVNEVEVQQKKTQFDAIDRNYYKDFDDEDSPIRKSVEKAKDVMMIKEHPFGDTLGAAVTVYANLKNITEYWFEQGKKAATDDKVNKAREQQIKDGKLTPPGSKGTVELKDSKKLSESEMETAKRFGFDKDPKKMKIYMNQILNRKG
jgi:hypothetical protein